MTQAERDRLVALKKAKKKLIRLAFNIDLTCQKWYKVLSRRSIVGVFQCGCSSRTGNDLLSGSVGSLQEAQYAT
jgi:hypothetical protein